MSEVSSGHDHLEGLVRRLEEVIGELRDAATDAERVDQLAEEALALSGQVGEALPRVIREIEDAAQADPRSGSEPESAPDRDASD